MREAGMNLQEAMKQATPGPLKIIPNLHYTSNGRNGVSKSFLSSDARVAGVAAVQALADISLEESDANAALLAHWYNKGPKLLAALNRVDMMDDAEWAATGPQLEGILAECNEVEGI